MLVASLSMGAETPLNVCAGTTCRESSAIARVALDGLETATLMIAGLAQLDEESITRFLRGAPLPR
jgi:hypothetical protein